MAVLPEVRREVSLEDGLLVVHRPAALTDVVGRGYGRERFASLLGAAFAGLAVLLAALGLYGMLSHSVRSRRREIGIRIALGARDAAVASHVVGFAMLVTGVGVALGLVGSIWLKSALGSFVFQTDAADPTILAMATTVMCVVSLVAAALPAIRATRVSPRSTLAGE